MSEILLGYELETGKAVSIPVRHLCVTGQTQESGKTTTLEALISRSGRRAIAFITKRGERSFESGRRILPYFQERTDWEFIESVLEAIMRQKMRFERAWIIRASKGAKSLGDVRSNIAQLTAKSKRSMDADIYMLLGEYLDKVLPLLARLPKTNEIRLETGLNVMDLRSYPEELQMLILASSLRWVHEHGDEVISIIPEAWKFAPQGRNTPVKLEVRKIAREGAGLKNYIWVDSQDIAGVEKEILRAAAVWLIGVQREANEIERALSSIPKGIKRPEEGDIPTLKLGQFFACWGEHVKKVYICPAWMTPADAAQIAVGKWTVEDFPAPTRRESEDTNLDYKAAFEEQRDRADRLERDIAALHAELQEARSSNWANRRRADAADGAAERAQNFPAAPGADSDEIAMALQVGKPVIDVTVRKYVIEADDSTLKGKLAVLISQNFFDSEATGNAAFNELQRRGFGTAKPNVYRELDKLASLGFLTKEGNGYKTVPGMKVNVKEVNAIA